MHFWKIILILLVAFLVFQLLYAGFFSLRAKDLLKKTYTGTYTLGEGNEMLIYATGDSVGAGVGATSFENSVVGRVANFMSKNNKITLTNNSISGNKMKDIIGNSPTKKQDIIILIIGSNDLFRFTNFADFRKNTKKVLSEYSPKAKTLIVIGPGRIFDADAIPLFMKPVYFILSKQYANIMEEESKKINNVIYVNPIDTKVSGEYGFTGASDHFHPNDEGHRFWFDLIKQKLTN